MSPIDRPPQDPVQSRQNKAEKIATPEFALDAWGYDQESLDRFIAAVSKGNAKLKETLENTLREGGGKAFGLKICELVAKNFEDQVDLVLSVPEWQIVKDAKELKPNEAKEQDKILRSSSPDEDWLNPESGTLLSYNFSPRTSGSIYGDWPKLDNARKNDKLAKVPHILQEVQVGYGCVINVGHSDILHKPVVKFASGTYRYDVAITRERRSAMEWNRSTLSFTSAVEDMEASVGIWDAEKGTPITPVREFQQSLFSDGSFKDNLPKLLAQALKKTGIDFGVQLEVVIDPQRPYQINLVQIRPVPGAIRRRIDFPTSETQKGKEQGEPLATSAVVNARFDFTSVAEIFRNSEEDFHYRGRHLEEKYIFKKSPVPDSAVSPKIGIYYYPSYLYMGRGAHYTYLGAYDSGYKVQITDGPIKPNDHHGHIDNVPGTAEVYDFLDRHCGLVSLSKEEIEKLRKALKAKTKLRIVSDGLIAAIYKE